MDRLASNCAQPTESVHSPQRIILQQCKFLLAYSAKLETQCKMNASSYGWLSFVGEYELKGVQIEDAACCVCLKLSSKITFKQVLAICASTF